MFLDEAQNIGGHGRVVMGRVMRRFTMVAEVLEVRCRQLRWGRGNRNDDVSRVQKPAGRDRLLVVCSYPSAV